MYTGQPNILRWLTSGFLQEKTSSWVLFLSTLCGVRLCTYTDVLVASAQRCIGISWSWSMALVASMIVLFFLSAIPFYCGLYGVEKSLLIPEALHKSLNLFDVNSLPLSDWKVLIFLSVWFSTKGLNSLHLFKNSIFSFKKYIQVLHKKSSIKET